MSIDITFEGAKNLLRDVVSERGEYFVYFLRVDSPYGSNGCSYVHEDADGNLTPGCGVGLALINAGVPMQKFIDLGINFGFGTSSALHALQCAGVLGEIENGVWEVFSDFQAKQDAGFSYGECLSPIL